MIDVTEMVAHIEDAHLDAMEAWRVMTPNVVSKFDTLWALRCDAELAVDFSHSIEDQHKRDYLWGVICNADRLCMDAMDAGLWKEKPFTLHAV